MLPVPFADILPEGTLHWDDNGDSWVVVDQMCGSTSVYSTHYFCRACCADLSELRVHHVRWCPYCGVEMTFLLDGQDRPHAQLHGGWPYDLLRERYPSWCSWQGAGDEPRIPTENGGWSQLLTVCRLLEGHDGDHEFVKGRERPPRNPLRGIQ
jgi:hypothetical protein